MNSARKRNQPKTVSDGPQLALLFRLHGARLPGSTRHKRWSAELLPLLVPPPPPPSTVVSNAPLSFGFGSRTEMASRFLMQKLSSQIARSRSMFTTHASATASATAFMDSVGGAKRALSSDVCTRNRVFKKPEWAVEWDARSAAWQAECAAWEAEMDA
ncbi:hypothetical protein EJB05_55501, partial [Eragrostis curvula]